MKRNIIEGMLDTGFRRNFSADRAQTVERPIWGVVKELSRVRRDLLHGKTYLERG